MFQNDRMWQTLEKLKHQLRDAGCRGLANQIYVIQMKLEAKITKDYLCKK